MATPVRIEIVADQAGAVQGLQVIEGRARDTQGRFVSMGNAAKKAADDAAAGMDGAAGATDNAGKAAGRAGDGARKAGDAFRKSGQQGKQAGDDTATAHTRAHDSARMLERMFGIELPRSATKYITALGGVGTALSAALNVTLIGTAAVAVYEVGERLWNAATGAEEFKKQAEEARKALHDLYMERGAEIVTPEQGTAKVKDIEGQLKQNKRLIDDMAGDPWIYRVLLGSTGAAEAANTKLELALAKAKDDTKKAEDGAFSRQLSLAAQVGAAGLKGFAAIRQEAASANNALDELAKHGKVGKDELDTSKMLNAELAKRKAAELAEDLKKEARDMQFSVAAIGASSAQQIVIEHDKALADLKQRYAQSLVDRRTYVAEAAAIEETARKKSLELQVDIVNQGALAVMQAWADEATGEEKITRDLEVEKERIRQAEVKAGVEMPLQREAAERRTAQQIKQLREQTGRELIALDDEVADADRRAAIAQLPEWQRASVEIVADYNRRIEELKRKQDEFARTHKGDADAIAQNEQDMNRLRVDAWTMANAQMIDEHKRMVDTLAGDIEQLFDGNVTDTILREFKHLVAKIVAAWLIGVEQMQGATTGSSNTGGGVLGGILGGIGKLFGFGTGSSAQAASTAAATSAPAAASATASMALAGGALFGNPSTAGTFTGGAFSGAGSTVGTALAPGVGGLNSSPMFGVASSLTTLPLTDLTGSTVPAQNAITSVIGVGGKGTSWLKGSAQQLSTLGIMGAALLGGKLGGTPGMIGTSLASMVALGALGYGPLAGAVGPNGFLAGSAGTALGALAGPVVGGLVGFGIGMQHGPLAGGLSGAGTGALTGLLIGGPVGAIIGGIVGLLGGIFGGLFGGGKRKRQAQALTQQYLTALNDVENQFKDFKLDYSTAMDDINQIQSSAQDSYNKLKDEGKHEYKVALAPAIQKVKDEIDTLEKERERRAGLVFGPPQFHTGGLVMFGSGGGWRLSADETLAVLKRGEFVVNPDATEQHRNVLEAINNSTQGGSTPSLSRLMGGSSTSVASVTQHQITINIQAWDHQDVKRWLRNGGAQMITNAQRDGAAEGGFPRH